MTNVQIRDVPDHVHRELARRAESAGQSLQQYLAAQLDSIISVPTVDDLISRVGRRTKGRLTTGDAIAAVQDERARR